MKMNSLKKYVELRAALLKEKAELEARLGQINSALGDEELESAPASVRRRNKAPAAISAPASGARRVRNRLSLRQAIMQVTQSTPLTKDQILVAIKKIGYKFGASNPLPSLNAVLYAKPKFTNHNGKFSPPT